MTRASGERVSMGSSYGADQALFRRLAAYTAIAAQIAQTHVRLHRGLASEQHVETIRVLAMMAGNVESAFAERRSATAVSK
jgi:hypothetical protein